MSTQNLYMNVYNSIIHNSKKTGKNPNIHQLTDKLWCIRTVEHYSAVKKSACTC
jgi:hypothetical protein